MVDSGYSLNFLFVGLCTGALSPAFPSHESGREERTLCLENQFGGHLKSPDGPHGFP